MYIHLYVSNHIQTRENAMEFLFVLTIMVTGLMTVMAVTGGLLKLIEKLLKRNERRKVDEIIERAGKKVRF